MTHPRTPKTEYSPRRGGTVLLQSVAQPHEQAREVRGITADNAHNP